MGCVENEDLGIHSYGKYERKKQNDNQANNTKNRL